MAEFDCAPVLLIGFNRPERLKAQVDRLRAVKPRAHGVGECRAPQPRRTGAGRMDCAVRALGGTAIPGPVQDLTMTLQDYTRRAAEDRGETFRDGPSAVTQDQLENWPLCRETSGTGRT